MWYFVVFVVGVLAGGAGAYLYAQKAINAVEAARKAL